MLGAAIGLALAANAHAGRPLATDDAGTEARGQCHLEAWFEKAQGSRATVLSPACGLTEELELGFEDNAGHPRSEQGHAAAFALKWVPAGASAGDWHFGLKLGAGRTHLRDEPSVDTGLVIGIASWQPTDAFAVHVNLGWQRYSKGEARTESPVALAAVWAPHPAWLVFGELTGHSRAALTQTVGTRWWLLPDRLGLDLTAGRQAAVPGSQVYSIGLGWYGWSW